MKKKKIIILTVILVIIVGVYLGARGFMTSIENNLDELAKLKISNIDLSKIKDGFYIGSYEVFPIEAEVKVTVKEHKITGIELVKHRNGQGAAAEIIPSKVIDAQSLEVDVIAGATSSSKVILKAIENALDKADQS